VKSALLIVLSVLFASAGVAARNAAPIDISGTWQFSVDLSNGGHGDPIFVFKQDKGILTGSYDGPLGKYEITGTIKDNSAVFAFEFSTDNQKRKATYTAVVESATKMSGTMEVTDGPTGTWNAVKK